MDQQLFEREVFEAFASATHLEVIPGTIENRNPPEPDIVCEIEGVGRIGFELTELLMKASRRDQI